MGQLVHSLAVKRNHLYALKDEEVPQPPEEIFHYLVISSLRKFFGYYICISCSNLNDPQSSGAH